MEPQRATTISECVRLLSQQDLDEIYKETMAHKETLTNPVCVCCFDKADAGIVRATDVKLVYSTSDEIINILPVKAVEQIQLCDYKNSIPFVGVMRGGDDKQSSHFCIISWED
jgi:hypothetical protein